jgi:hypothetical protein
MENKTQTTNESEAQIMESVMRGQAGGRKIGKVWIRDNYDGEVVTYSTHFANEWEFLQYVKDKVANSKTKEVLRKVYDNQDIA